MNGRGLFILLFHSLIPFKLTGNVLNGFFLINLSSIPVTLRVRIGFISKKLIDSFREEGLGWSLSLGIN